jgi:hypothetical protein
MGTGKILGNSGDAEGKNIAESAAPSRGVVTRRSLLAGAGAAGVMLGIPRVFATVSTRTAPEDEMGSNALQRDFLDPPRSAQAGVYWWWLDGAASMEGITADLESMSQQGISYALLFSAGGGGADAPKGPPFMSEEWRKYFRHAVQEAARLGIEMGVNICDGWNCGGPWVPKEDAVKDFVWDEIEFEGPGEIDRDLPLPSKFMAVPDSRLRVPPKAPLDWYQDIAVLACRERQRGVWQLKDIKDLTPLTSNGRLRWQAPEGSWTILRIGYAVIKSAGMDPEVGYHLIKDAASPTPAWEIDPMSAGAMDRHFAHTGSKLIEDAGALAGKTLKNLHIDSWEIGVPTWTDDFAARFRALRNYDPIRYLPILAGKKLDTEEAGERFTWDFRRTIADLSAQNYYGRLAHLCREHGVGTDCEAGGPFYTQFIDPMEAQGIQDVPMAEFWSSRRAFPLDAEQRVATPLFRSSEQTFPAMNFGSIKQMAGAAHAYGKSICQAESYTSMNEDWSEDPYFLKSLGDRAFCLGLTRQVLTFFILQPTLTDKPGFGWEYVGTNFGRNVTWWPLSHAWLRYLARCQYLLRQGLFAADIVYFAGETVPNFVLLDRKPVTGYDFDQINAQALLTRASARDGKLTLADGVSYRYVVVAEGVGDRLTPAVLNKIRELVEGGVTLVGTRPRHSLGLTSYPHSEQHIKQQADALWGTEPANSGARRVGAGRVLWGRTIEEVMDADGLKPDVELRNMPAGVQLDWLHRRVGSQDIYFVANLTEQAVSIEAVFRIHGKMPELWDPVNGETRDLEEFREEEMRTVIPLKFAAKQSFFVVFRRAAKRAEAPGARNFPVHIDLAKLTGSWVVHFDAKWKGPEKVVFQRLDDWSQRPEESIRYYSGKATYRRTFDLTEGRYRRIYLDLGEVKNVAQVRLNGKDLGILWTAPWRVDITAVAKRKGNELEIDVVNLWPNRLTGDGLLPKNQRVTVTNVRTYNTPAPVPHYCDTEVSCAEPVEMGPPPKLLPSGLLGPVTVLGERAGF